METTKKTKLELAWWAPLVGLALLCLTGGQGDMPEMAGIASAVLLIIMGIGIYLAREDRPVLGGTLIIVSGVVGLAIAAWLYLMLGTATAMASHPYNRAAFALETGRDVAADIGSQQVYVIAFGVLALVTVVVGIVVIVRSRSSSPF